MVECKNIISFVFKSVLFEDDQIVLIKRKKQIIIKKEMIEEIKYAKFTIANCLALIGDWRSPGVLYIILKKNVNKHKDYAFIISFKNLLKIPKLWFDKIIFKEKWKNW